MASTVIQTGYILSVFLCSSQTRSYPGSFCPQRILRQGTQDAHSSTGYQPGQDMKFSRYNEREIFEML